MDDFKKNNNENKNKYDLQADTDEYLSNIQKELHVKRTFGLMGEKTMPELLLNDTEEARLSYESEAMYSNMARVQLWSSLFTLVTVNALIYPRLQKFTRNRLRIRSFFPMHFTCIFPMSIINGFVLGMFKGYYDYNAFMIRLENLRKVR